MRKKTKEILEQMNQEDIYSLILFALFRLKEIPEYSSISEMAYLLDGTSLINLLEYYGGTTIRIPTLKEFRIVICALVLYQYVNIEGISYNQALKLINYDVTATKELKECYNKVVEVLNKYDFNKKEAK